MKLTLRTLDTRGAATCGEEERGQVLVEYALILSFVSVMALAVTPIGQWVVNALATTVSDL